MSCILYRMYDAKSKLLYVGISESFMNRLDKHSRAIFLSAVDHITLEHHPTRAAALEAEKYVIQHEKPIRNIVHRVRSFNAQTF